jgi:hypothetical protein
VNHAALPVSSYIFTVCWGGNQKLEFSMKRNGCCSFSLNYFSIYPEMTDVWELIYKLCFCPVFQLLLR